jgi:exosortase/archaeosortase family protein
LKIFKNIQISTTLKKEMARFAISFFFAWLFSALISDFPYFKKLIIQDFGLDALLTNLTVNLTESILNLFGFSTFTNGNFLQIAGTPGIIFEYGCLGFRELAFFVVFIALQFGKFKHKAWYIPSGIILLILLNTIRAVIIALGQYQNPANTDLIHDIISPVIMYPAILFLWIFWISNYGKPPVDDTFLMRLFKRILSFKHQVSP